MFKLKPNYDVSKFIQDLKPSVTKWARGNIHPKFEWQDGFGAFTIGESQVAGVRRYMQNQEEHHRKTLFEQEFKDMLEQSGIEFDERYLWS